MSGPPEQASQKNAPKKVGNKPPYKQTLSSQPCEDLPIGDRAIYMIDPEGSPGGHAVQAGWGEVKQDVVEAEAFIAPHVIADAIKDLPKEEQEVIRQALMNCTESPEDCNSGFNAEDDRHLTVKSNHGVHPNVIKTRQLAEQDIKDAETSIHKEVIRQGQTSNQRKPIAGTQHRNADAPPSPKATSLAPKH